MNPNKPKVKKAFKSGAPRKGYKWKEDTSGRIPDPAIVPDRKKPYTPKPMRTVASGTTGGGKARTTVKSKARSL